MDTLKQNSDFLCSVCSQAILAPFFMADALPTLCSVLYPSLESAKQAPRGDCELSLCPACGWITNTVFTPELLNYDDAYDNALHFSERFGEYAAQLADRLVDQHQLKGKTVVEIGCGDGHFLSLLAERGVSRCVGFDPSAANVETVDHKAVEIVAEHFSGGSVPQCELIVCRHVLEHIPNPKKWLEALRENLKGDSLPAVYCEVPNSYFILDDLSVWDIIYEHCNYFVPETLKFLFEMSGFEVSVCSSAYGGQFAFIEAIPADADALELVVPEVKDTQRLEQLASQFPSLFEAKINAWKANLKAIQQNHGRTVAWGAGSKGTMFATLLDDAYQDGQIVDVNPRKQLKHLPISGIQVVSPEHLADSPPGAVLVMNPLYAEEIKAMLAGLGMQSTVYTV